MKRNESQISAGRRVRHPLFGLGEVRTVHDQGLGVFFFAARAEQTVDPSKLVVRGTDSASGLCNQCLRSAEDCLADDDHFECCLEAPKPLVNHQGDCFRNADKAGRPIRRHTMVVTAWSNGSATSSGAGYGVKIHERDREAHFNRNWPKVYIDIAGVGFVDVDLDRTTFWERVGQELIHVEIGRWLLAQKLAPWPAGRPPRLALQPLSASKFRLLR